MSHYYYHSYYEKPTFPISEFVFSSSYFFLSESTPYMNCHNEESFENFLWKEAGS